MITELQKVSIHINYQEVAQKIKNQPIAVLFRRVLDFKDHLEKRIAEKITNTEISLRHHFSWKEAWVGPSGDFMAVVGIATACIGVFAGAVGAAGVGIGLVLSGGLMSETYEKERCSIEYMKYELSELNKENEYVNSMLNLLEEFDKTDGGETRSKLFREIKLWYYCQDSNDSLLLPDIFETLQNYLDPNDAIKQSFAIIQNPNTTEQEMMQAWAGIEKEMQCGFPIYFKINRVYMCIIK